MSVTYPTSINPRPSAGAIPGYPTATPGKVRKILVALYGLHASAYEFYMLLMSLLLGLGMIRCEVDHGVFFGEWTSPPDPAIPMPVGGRSLVMHLPLHVDDGLVITNSKPLYFWFIAQLAKRLHIVDMGECARFLGIKLIRDRTNRKLFLSSKAYIEEMLDDWNMTDCKPASLPFSGQLAELKPAPPNALPDIPDVDLRANYMRLTGQIIYIAWFTRPELVYYAMCLAQYNANPTRAHMLVAKHCLRYLAGTKDLLLCFGDKDPDRTPESLAGYLKCVGCSDSDWASDIKDRKSISGYCFYYENSLVSWSAAKQKSVAGSSTEAEYYAMALAMKEAIWMRVFLELNKLPVPKPFPLLSDNQAALALSKSQAISSRSKHIDIRHHFIRQHVSEGTFTTSWMPTADMPADLFTKPLPFPLFAKHRRALGMIEHTLSQIK